MAKYLFYMKSKLKSQILRNKKIKKWLLGADVVGKKGKVGWRVQTFNYKMKADLIKIMVITVDFLK